MAVQTDIQGALQTLSGTTLDSQGAVQALSAAVAAQVGGYAPAGSAAGKYQRKARVSGDATLQNTAWTDFDTGLDLTITAATGNVVLVGLSGYVVNGSTQSFLDFATIVAAAPVNYVSGLAAAAGDDGITALHIGFGLSGPLSCCLPYTVVAGDVASGQVVFRLRFRTGSAANAVYHAANTRPFVVWAKNLG